MIINDADCRDILLKIKNETGVDTALLILMGPDVNALSAYIDKKHKHKMPETLMKLAFELAKSLSEEQAKCSENCDCKEASQELH